MNGGKRLASMRSKYLCSAKGQGAPGYFWTYAQPGYLCRSMQGCCQRAPPATRRFGYIATYTLAQFEALRMYDVTIHLSITRSRPIAKVSRAAHHDSTHFATHRRGLLVMNTTNYSIK